MSSDNISYERKKLIDHFLNLLLIRLNSKNLIENKNDIDKCMKKTYLDLKF